MEIEKGKTSSGEQLIEFADQTGSDIGLWVEEHSKQGKSVKLLYLDVETDYFKFSQEDIKTLLPYLQSFASSGTLEPTQEPTLQGGESTLKRLSELQNCIQKAKHQETKDSMICHTVILLSSFAPSEVKEKALELLRTYNSEERIAQSPLQGEDATDVLDSIDQLYKNTKRENAILAATNKYVKDLKQLLREWKKYGQPSSDSKSPDELIYLTDEILGE